MANQLCVCGDGMSNTGFPNCIKTPQVIKKAIFVQLVANDGTLNKVDPATMSTLSAFTALINHADTSKRCLIEVTVREHITDIVYSLAYSAHLDCFYFPSQVLACCLYSGSSC